jgi:uncharacterized protein YaaW (UPF0174 family)
MGIKYRKDDDLDFLQYCNEEDLSVLTRYLTHDKDGEPRHTGELLSDEKFKSLAHRTNRHRSCWTQIAGEFQLYGGHSFANIFRGHGVLYREILCDVSNRLDAKFDKAADSYTNENFLLEKLLSKSWEKMTSKQKEELLQSMGIAEAKPDKTGFEKLIASVFGSKIGSFNGWSMAAGGTAALYGINVMGFLGGTIAARAIGLVGGPIGMAISAILMMLSVFGPAYRVTVPATIQVAYMRRAYAERDRF